MIEALKKSIENDKEFLEKVKKFGVFSEFIQSLDKEDFDNLDKMLESGMLKFQGDNMLVFPCYGYVYVITLDKKNGLLIAKNMEMVRYADQAQASTKSFKSAIEFLFTKRRDMKMEN